MHEKINIKTPSLWGKDKSQERNYKKTNPRNKILNAEIRQIWEQPVLKLIELYQANSPSRAEKPYDS